jgi:hypothetical protein
MATPKRKKKKHDPTDAELMRQLFPKKVLDSVKRDIPKGPKRKG